jgi:hypothetical protein
MVDSKAKLKRNGDKASPFVRLFIAGNISDMFTLTEFIVGAI